MANTRGKISKKSMIHNDATPDIEVDAETYEVRADGELLTCAPAETLPMAQRYFLFDSRHSGAPPSGEPEIHFHEQC